jgi:hypothetical protein
MGQEDHVMVLPTRVRATLPGKVATLADAKGAAETVHGELLFRFVDKCEPYRLPSLATDLVLPRQLLEFSRDVFRPRAVWLINLPVPAANNPAD